MITDERDTLIDCERDALIDDPDCQERGKYDHESHTRIDPKEEKSYEERPRRKTLSTVERSTVLSGYEISNQGNMGEYHGDFFDGFNTSWSDTARDFPERDGLYLKTRFLALKRTDDTHSESKQEDNKANKIPDIGKRKIKYQHRSKISRIDRHDDETDKEELDNTRYPCMTIDKMTLKSCLTRHEDKYTEKAVANHGILSFVGRCFCEIFRHISIVSHLEPYYK